MSNISAKFWITWRINIVTTCYFSSTIFRRLENTITFLELGTDSRSSIVFTFSQIDSTSSVTTTWEIPSAALILVIEGLLLKKISSLLKASRLIRLIHASLLENRTLENLNKNKKKIFSRI